MDIKNNENEILVEDMKQDQLPRVCMSNLSEEKERSQQIMMNVINV